MSDGAGSTGLVRRLGVGTATLTVVANMIGTGVFTTTGILLDLLHAPALVISVWAAGGLLALFGAFAYAELGARIGRNGGEYRFLTDLMHPALGFVSAWVSLAVGFSAPIAASALAFGEYVSAIGVGAPSRVSASALIVLLSVLHAARVEAGARLQNAFTVGKVLLILAFMAGAAVVGLTADGATATSTSSLGATGSGGPLRVVSASAVATALILVSFAYSGWNGAAYLAGEVRDPERALPRALVGGTLVVLALYVGLNAVFVGAVPVEALAGQVEVGHVVATRLFGDVAGRVLSGLISLALVSSVSAMIMVGPRVYEAVGVDHPRLRVLTTRGGAGRGPVAATSLQAALALGMVWTSSFETLLIYIGLTLSLSSAATVTCVFIDRRRHPEAERPYRALGHPLTTALFIGFMLAIVAWSVSGQPVAAVASAGTLAVGGALYFLVREPGDSSTSGRGGSG